MLMLRVIRETPAWIAVDKPAGFHTHPPEDPTIRLNPRWNALAILERQFGQALYPLHRLDRAASGLLLYSRDRAVNSAFQRQFAAGEVNKIYFVLLRGEFRGETVFAEPLTNEAGTPLPAETRVAAHFSFSLPIPHPRGGNRVFTVARAEPRTGRFHQIRRHLARAGFPLVNDSRHGDKKLNREFAALTGLSPLFLRCMELGFTPPGATERVRVAGRWSRDWHRLFELAGACPVTASPSPAPPSLS